MASNTETFKVAGISYYKDDIIKDFKLEIDDEFNYESSHVELIPEPENKHDPNAIKIIVDGTKIGYVPKELTSFVRDFIESPDYLGAEVHIFGEKYQEYKNEDDETDAITLWANIHLYTEFVSDEEYELEKKNIKYYKISLICGIIITLCSLITYKIFIILGIFAILYSLYNLNKRTFE